MADAAPPSLEGRRVRLRPLARGDVTEFESFLHEAEVAPWWPAPDSRAELVRDLLEDDEQVWLAVDDAHDGRFVGVVGYVEVADPDYRSCAIDITLTSRVHGRGLGTDTLRTLARYLVGERGHHRLTIDPAADNARAIRAYKAVGFEPVGVMRSYERMPDGQWRDALLMDLLADELRG